jgi:hypothetical protein
MTKSLLEEPCIQKNILAITTLSGAGAVVRSIRT